MVEADAMERRYQKIPELRVPACVAESGNSATIVGGERSLLRAA